MSLRAVCGLWEMLNCPKEERTVLGSRRERPALIREESLNRDVLTARAAFVLYF